MSQSRLVMVKNRKMLRELIQHCKTTGYCSNDYETTGLKYYLPDERPLILGISFQPGSAWIIPLAHKESPFRKKDKWKRIFREFGREVLENPDIIKVAWNFKFEQKWHMAYGIKCIGRLFDGMLAKYCLDEERPHGLKDFVKLFFPEFADYNKNIKGQKWSDIPMSELAPYCGIDADLTLRAMFYLERKLIKSDFYNLFRNLLMMGSKVLAESEFRGMLINKPYLETLIVKYKAKIEEADAKMRNDQALLKFEAKHRKQHIINLITKVQLEIEKLRKDDDNGSNDRKVKNREAKINNIAAGKLGVKEIYQGFNFNSPQQVTNFFFAPGKYINDKKGEIKYGSKYGLKLKPFKKTDTGAPSTDEESILHLASQDKSGFLNVLLEYRGLVKLNSTYIEGVYDKLDPQSRVHTSFKIHGTVTGRLSSEDPNLQNIPRGTTSSDIKKMFIPNPGYLLMEVDYSQAELRVVAEIAKDKAMIEFFRKGWNIHVATACKINNATDRYEEIKKIIKVGESIDPSELLLPKNKDYLFWVKQKKRAKTLNFGILYGQGARKLSIELECTEKEAEQFIKDWFRAYPQVAKWIKRQQRHAHKHGYVMNLFGRKRRLHDIDSDRYYMQLEAERQAVNAPIQGCASDFTLFSQVVVREEILKGNFPRDMHHVYTVHDSIGYYIRPKDINWVVPKLIEICNNPQTKEYFNFELEHVRMKVSPEIGVTWVDLDEWKPEINYEKEYKKWVKEGQLMMEYQ